MITLRINKKKVTAKKGETLLKVAQREGIYIPTLCYHKDLTPYGGCRVCLVQVKGWPSPVAACSLPIEEGMVVETNTPLLKKLRIFSLQLILSEHPHACLICTKEKDCAQYQECIQKSAITFGCKFCSQNGKCELQDLVEYLDVKEIPFDFHYRNLNIERTDPFFDRDYNICILCGRCVRVCQEVRNASVLDFHHRGPETLVGTAFDLPHLDTGCQFCGACIDVCPTGALRDRYGKWSGRPERSVKTTCTLCSIGCSIRLNCLDTTIINSTPDDNQICVRGRFGIAPVVHHPRRVTAPMMRKDNRIVEVEWEEALDFVYDRLTKHYKKTGVVFSPQLSIEALEALYELAEQLQCRTLTTLSVIDECFVPLDLKKISGDVALIIINTDVVSDFSPLLLKLRKRLKHRSTFVVIDTMASKMAQVADLWIRPDAGREGEVLNCLFGQGKIKKSTFISREDVKSARSLLSRKTCFVLYNPFNIKNISIPRDVKTIAVPSSINTLRIGGMGTDASIQEVLRDNKIRCLYLCGIAPELKRNYETVIVQDSFFPSCEFDVFLPAATFAEIDGTVMDIFGKVKRVRKAIEPRGQARSDEWIVREIGRRLNFPKNPRKPKRRKKMVTDGHHSIRLSEAHPIRLIVRENSYVYRSTPLSQLLKGFERLRADNCVWVGSRTAKKYKIKDRDVVTITGKGIRMTMPARVSDDVPGDTVVVFRHASAESIESQPVAVRAERGERGV